jgi:N-acetylneuraminate synthase/N,N'-diacetyllegionaminate synthase
MLRRLELGASDFATLRAYCQAKGIVFLSTPHDTESIDVLEALGVGAYKVGSGDITNLPFLRAVAAHGKPILLSTGMCTLGEVEAALAAIREEQNDRIVLLHCVSEYPAAVEDCNLRAIQTLRTAFHTPVGYSDHTMSEGTVLAAVALGACVIEKHLTLNRGMPGPDHAASAEPQELARLVASIRAVERALGDGVKRPTAGELENRAAVRKSVVARHVIPAGTVIEREMLAVKRPGTGLHPGLTEEIIGKRARVRIDEDTQVDWWMLDA